MVFLLLVHRQGSCVEELLLELKSYWHTIWEKYLNPISAATVGSMLLMNHETILRSSNLGEIGCNGTPYEFGSKG
jgi:hypothetical protein